MEFRTFKAGGRTFKAKVHTFIEKENLPATRFCRAVCVVLETDSLDHECFVGVALTFPGDVFSKKEGVIRATRTALRNAKHRNSNLFVRDIEFLAATATKRALMTLPTPRFDSIIRAIGSKRAVTGLARKVEFIPKKALKSSEAASG